MSESTSNMFEAKNMLFVPYFRGNKISAEVEVGDIPHFSK